MGGGWVVGGWWGCTWQDKMCRVVRGCVLVPVRDYPVVSSFYMYHTNFNRNLPTLISLLYCCLVYGRMV